MCNFDFGCCVAKSKSPNPEKTPRVTRKMPDNTKNLRTEKLGLAHLIKKEKGVFEPTKEQRQHILKLLGLDPRKFARSFDALRLLVPSFEQVKGPQHIQMIEIKVTSKHLPNFPDKFFFGMTKNEEDLMKLFGENFKLCLLSVYGEGKYLLLTQAELEKRIKNRRIQYQINL
jgi:hypothetical protein